MMELLHNTNVRLGLVTNGKNPSKNYSVFSGLARGRMV